MGDFRISVALCTYNGARFLLDQLNSIACQTRLPEELVIFDDRSSDGTVAIAKAFALQSPFPVRVEVNEQNLGSRRNFERSVSSCSGDVIALADQDDVWEPQKLAVIETMFREHDTAGYVFSDAELLDAEGSFLNEALWESVGFSDALLNRFSTGLQAPVLLRRSVVTGATMAFRSSLKDVIIPFSPNFEHDCWIALLASCIGRYGVPISERLIRYRQHSAQQIGARRKSIPERIAALRRGETQEYDRARLGMSDLRERLLLAADQGRVYPAGHLRLVEEKLKHCSCRCVARSEQGLKRVRKVLAEALTGRYGMFSNSWRSIVADLCF